MIMKRFLSLVILIAIWSISFSQSHELSFGIGTSTYYGDLGVSNNKFLQPISEFNTGNMHMSYTGGYRYNFPQYLSIGLNLSMMYLSAYDSDNDRNGDNLFRKMRNLSFHTDIYEASLTANFEPLRNDFRWNEDNWFISPYIGAGIGVFKFNPKTFYGGQEVELQPLGTEGQGLLGGKAKYGLTQMNMPLTLGVKFYNPARTFSVALDATYRYTYTDYLDDVSTVYADPAGFGFYPVSQATLANALHDRAYETFPGLVFGPGHQRGNSKDNDTYLSLQVKFSFYLLGGGSKDYNCFRIK
jgi:hypothetical protein